MSRLGSSSDTVYVKPSNNIFTVLAAVATVVVILGLVALWMRSDSLFGGLLSADPASSSARTSSR
jgi:hypothetical protein